MILELKYQTDNKIGTKQVTQGLQYVFEYKTIWIPFENITYAYNEMKDGEGYIKTISGGGFRLDKESFQKVVKVFKTKALMEKGGV